MTIRKLVIGRLSEHLDEIRSYIDGLSEENLRERHGGDEWSLMEIVHHLAATQESYIEITTRILVEERPALLPVCPEDHSESEYRHRDLRRRLLEFDEQRKNLLSLLSALTEKQWKREGVHPLIRHFSIETCMEELMRHEESHLYEMYRLFFGVQKSA